MNRAAQAIATAARRIPCVSLLLSLGAVTIAFAPRLEEALEFNRAHVWQAWRLFTGHWTHWSFEHMAWDSLAFLVLGALAERMDRRGFFKCLFACAAVVPVGIYFFLPQITHYRGLSGIDSALFGFVLMRLARSSWENGVAPDPAWLPSSRARCHGEGVKRVREGDRGYGHLALAAIMLAAFLAKIVFELSTNKTLFVQSDASRFVPVPLAHLLGLAVGLAIAAGRRCR